MRNILIFLTILTLILACDDKKKEKNTEIKISKKSPEFEITKDTFDFQINGFLKKVVYFKDKFNCIIEMNDGNSFKKIILLSKKGYFIKETPVPNGIEEMMYYGFNIENDSLYIKREQFDKENYLFDESLNIYKKTLAKQFKIYDDKEYSAYSTCNGEFGGTIFFQNKKTNLRYEGSSTCPIIINKIGTEYYVTNNLSHDGDIANVLKITNPENLENSDWDFKNDLGSIKTKGIKTILKNTNLYISTSFVYKEKLFHIYSDWKKTYIGIIENEKMKMIYEFDFYFYSVFNQVTDDSKQILNFMTRENKEKGILIIDEKNLKFRFIN